MTKYLIIAIFLLTVPYNPLKSPTQITIQPHLPQNKDKVLYGKASYYDYKIGEWSSIGHNVCAVRDFIRYSYLEVTNIDNGKSVEVCITDYGPDKSIHPDRIIDLSSTAFNAISSTKLGLINVKVKQLNKKCR